MTAARRSGQRRTVLTMLVVVGLATLAGAFAAWRLAPSPPASPRTGGVWWRLTGGPESTSAFGEAGAPVLDQTTVQTTTEIPIVTYFPAPGGQLATDDSWLGTPTITYTPMAVTITMHVSKSFSCGKPTATSRPVCGWSLEPRYVRDPVHLSEPLGGRALFDGSVNPPVQRWFTWSHASSIDLAAVKAAYADACERHAAIDDALCQLIVIEGMTAEGRMLAVPTTLGPEDKDRAYAICDRLALAHVDADPEVPGYEQGIRLLGRDGQGLAACSLRL